MDSKVTGRDSLENRWDPFGAPFTPLPYYSLQIVRFFELARSVSRNADSDSPGKDLRTWRLGRQTEARLTGP